MLARSIDRRPDTADPYDVAIKGLNERRSGTGSGLFPDPFADPLAAHTLGPRPCTAMVCRHVFKST